MKLYLAPMEGVVDWVMRDVLTQIGGIDHCITEFIRVTDRVLPARIFYEFCPELKTESKTRGGTPVAIQFLGGQAQPLLQNALKAIELGAKHIDLNFGCPAKLVNRHDGGAALLQHPDRIYDIVSTLRKGIPTDIPVTAKIRLGFDKPEMCLLNAEAVASAGADHLTVHCRTKTDMYKPPAYWEWIPRIKEKINIPVIANGDIWTKEDFQKCKAVTNCDQFMIGRGAIQNPFIFLEIKQSLEQKAWKEKKQFLPTFFESSTGFKSEYFAQARTKQWLLQLSKSNPEAVEVFNELKVITQPKVFKEKLDHLCLL